MSVPPESIQVSQCYLASDGRVRRVTSLFPGRVQYEQRPGHRVEWKGARVNVLELRSFAFSVERPVPSDWTLETEERSLRSS